MVLEKKSSGGPWVRCPECNGKRHPQEMVKAITGEEVCYKCADDPKLLKKVKKDGRKKKGS